MAFRYWKGHTVAGNTFRPVYIAVLETAAHLSVSKVTIKRAIRPSEFSYVRIGRAVRVAVVDLDQFAVVHLIVARGGDVR